MAEKTEEPGMGMKLCVYGISKKFPSIKNLTTNVLVSKMNPATVAQAEKEKDVERKVLLLDARPEEEYNISHIPGAVRVDYKADPDKLSEALPQLKDPGIDTVVAYCSVGYRSCMVAENLHKLYEAEGKSEDKRANIYNLEGGLFKWANENRPMVNVRDQPTVVAHPFNPFFGKLLRSELRKTALD